MQLHEVLIFIRDADEATWTSVIREMENTRRRRDEQAARSLSVGASVVCCFPNRGESFTGRILRINRRRVILETVEEESGQRRLIGVPASTLTACS
jgi:hypothetical protein